MRLSPAAAFSSPAASPTWRARPAELHSNEPAPGASSLLGLFSFGRRATWRLSRLRPLERLRPSQYLTAQRARAEFGFAGAVQPRLSSASRRPTRAAARASSADAS